MNDYKLYWFNTKEEGDAFLADENNDFRGYFRENKFDKPGWYHLYEYKQRCPRGCCYDYYIQLRDACSYLSELYSLVKYYDNKRMDTEADILNVKDIIAGPPE